MNIDAKKKRGGEEEVIHGGRRQREKGREERREIAARTSQRCILCGVYLSFLFFLFLPFLTRSCAFRGGLAKLINVNLLT